MMERHITTKNNDGMTHGIRYAILISQYLIELSGVLLCPWACLIMAIGISALILGLWPMHLIWTYYCIIRYMSCSSIFGNFTLNY